MKICLTNVSGNVFSLIFFLQLVSKLCLFAFIHQRFTCVKYVLNVSGSILISII